MLVYFRARLDKMTVWIICIGSIYALVNCVLLIQALILFHIVSFFFHLLLTVIIVVTIYQPVYKYSKKNTFHFENYIENSFKCNTYLIPQFLRI